MAFEFQRNAIEGAHEAVQNSVQMQQNVGTTVVDSFTPARDVSKRSTDLARTGVEAYFDAVESVAPAGSGLTEVRQTIHEAIDTVEESQLEAIDQFETAFESGTESSEEFLEEFLAALDEQVTTLLENHEDLEAQTVEALEGIEEGIEELRAEFEARGEELQEQLESQAEAVQEQLEDVTEGAQNAADTSA
jgi:DNA anti-recombination protein RmuC